MRETSRIKLFIITSRGLLFIIEGYSRLSLQSWLTIQTKVHCYQKEEPQAQEVYGQVSLVPVR